MIKIENTETFGWEAAIRGMRNPMNSWDKSDSKFCNTYSAEEWCNGWKTDPDDSTKSVCPLSDRCEKDRTSDYSYTHIGKNDLNLMKHLCSAGTDHRKFMRMIVVYCDITAPLYWWKEFDTYKVGTVANSCSTMHRIHDKKFTLDDFSHEHIVNDELFSYSEAKFGGDIPHQLLCRTINVLNAARERYLETGYKKYWWQMIQTLPSSYNQKRTIMTNYEVLANIFPSRRIHKLDEWHDFCDWIKALPYSELITREE